jgi:hypothetical protein
MPGLLNESSIDWGGQTFRVMANASHCVTYDPKQNRYRMEARPGDRREQDPATVRRVGLHGWEFPLSLDREHTIAWDQRYIVGCHGAKSGDWLVPFEIHCKPLKDEPDRVGPSTLTSGWSDGAKASRFRAMLNNGAPKMLYDAPDLVEGKLYRFVTQHRFGQDGLWRVMCDGKLLFEYKGPYGYGPRLPYLCLRSYSNDDRPVVKLDFSALSVG